MALLVQELQKESRTASRREGVLIGDGTQKQRSYSRKRGRGMRWLRVILLHGEKRFEYGYEVESTHYADTEKDYPLLSAIYEPSAERAAELEEARQRQKMGLDLRQTADRVTWLKYLIEQREDVEWIELCGRELAGRRQKNGRWRGNSPFRGRTWPQLGGPEETSRWVTLQAGALTG
jgi:hypothetical protein